MSSYKNEHGHTIWIERILKLDFAKIGFYVGGANVIGGEMVHLIFVWKQVQKDLYHTDKILVNIHRKAAVIHHQSNLVCE